VIESLVLGVHRDRGAGRLDGARACQALGQSAVPL